MTLPLFPSNVKTFYELFIFHQKSNYTIHLCTFLFHITETIPSHHSALHIFILSIATITTKHHIVNFIEQLQSLAVYKTFCSEKNKIIISSYWEKKTDPHFKNFLFFFLLTFFFFFCFGVLLHNQLATKRTFYR